MFMQRDIQESHDHWRISNDGFGHIGGSSHLVEGKYLATLQHLNMDFEGLSVHASNTNGISKKKINASPKIQFH